jgi:hypothetical protein
VRSYLYNYLSMIFLNNLTIILLTINEIVSSNLWIFSIYEIIILGAIISLASKAGNKILKGLQGTAATTIIVRGAYDAYNEWKKSNSNDNNSGNNSTNTDKTPKTNRGTKKLFLFMKHNET